SACRPRAKPQSPAYGRRVRPARRWDVKRPGAGMLRAFSHAGLGARPWPMSQIEDRLAAAGIVLPKPNAPVANYVPFVRAGDLVHISGQVSLDASGGIKGVVGEDV